VKAIVYEQYGSPEVLAAKEVDTPVPGDGEVLIRVHAVAINDWDWSLLTGIPRAYRLMSGWLRPKQQILGSDVAGRVEAVGMGVSRFKPGDEVFGDLSDRWGGFAEYVCAPQSAVAPKPAAMSFVEAASIPQAAMLAVQGLRDVGNLQAGQALLINGAGGGVGTLGLQVAKAMGAAEVTGVDSAAKLEMMRALGFDHVIDYKRTDFTRTGTRYDLILDVKTDRSPFDYVRALRAGGTYVTVGGSPLRLLLVLFLGPLVRLLTGKAMRIVALKANKDLAYMCELYAAGKLNPVIDRPRTLDEVPEAMGYFGAGEHHGKVVIVLEN
jgi:NADPH:quinone reductase-like Zn-dependent oxidoreductase